MIAEPNRCPSAAALELLLAEQLPGSELDPVETHVESCGSCQERLEQMSAQALTVTKLSRADYQFEAQPDESFLCRLKQVPRPRLLGSEPAASANEQPLSEEPPARGLMDASERTRLGQYEILETLGKGNMGVVYKAVHTELGKIVALKSLPASLADEVGIARFKNEARAAGRLDHQNIVTAHDAGRAEGVHFLVMTFVDGMDLARLIQRQGRLSIPDACELVRQAAVGLQHAFERGLVHRDIKPSNLMLARDGIVKVLDLGIARSCGATVVPERLTATGMVLGTADYLAPEQWENPHAVDSRADIYSLGCTLYHLISGHPPFSGSQYPSLLTKMRGHLEAPAPPIAQERPDVPDQLAFLLHRMLSKSPADRLATPGEVVEALRPFTAGANLRALLEGRDMDQTKSRDDSPLILAGDTDRSAHTLTNDRSDVRRRDQPVKRFSSRYGIALGVAGACLALVSAVALWVTQQGSQPPADPVKIETMTVRLYRGESAKPVGDIGKTIQAIFVDDTVRVSALLNAPAYCYLLAFNPDGKEQLCYPEDQALDAVYYPEHRDAKSMATRPARSADLLFPRDQYFEPGIPGLQVFVLIASAEPLPPYAEWRSQVRSIPWKKTDSYAQAWCWQFDGENFSRLPAERGTRVERGAAPPEFRELCNLFRARPEVQAVRALAFPVTKK
jgi:serine/threonine protein kinase